MLVYGKAVIELTREPRISVTNVGVTYVITT